MNQNKINQTIDRITHGTLTQTIQAIVDELFDQGFEQHEIREYLQSKQEEAEHYIIEQIFKK